jgi:NADH dehydrogenase/NADH:ubiquinone oxidoreductase subunit G
MQQFVTITMDGATVSAPRGTSVLEAALNMGICIPHLCHYPTLAPNGACRLCIVELVKDGRSRVTASCTLEAREGLVVETNTPKIKALRRNIAELLVAEAPNARAIQDVAARCGVTTVRYPFRNNDCVLCGRCVRVCSETWGAKAIGFIGRGAKRIVDFPFGRKPASCKNCNTCIDICPMTITPCAGPQRPGEERLCGQCASQLTMAENLPDTCVACELGKGFHCSRQGPLR